MSRLVPIIRVAHRAPTPPPAPVPTPSLGAPTVIGTSEIDVTAAYSGPPTLATFTFEYSLTALFTSFVTFAVQSGATAHATGLSAATKYYFRVFATTAESPARNSGFSSTVSATTNPVPTSLVKFNEGHYLWSFNISGTGASNQGEMNNLADARSANVLGGAWIYRWGTVQSAKGAYSFNSTVGADFNYLQSVRPGARFCAAFATRVFGGPYTAATNVSAGWIPAYILASSAYGGTGGSPGPNGTQFGYTLGEYISGSNYGQVAACIWRAAVMTEKIALFVNFLNSIVPDGSGLTWNEHPLFEAIIDWDESVLALAGPNAPPADYSWSALMTQLEAWWTQVAAAATQTSVLTCLNFPAQNGLPGDMLTFMNSALAAGAAFSCPDVKFNDNIDAQLAFRGKVYNGTAWVSGGTPFTNRMDSSPQVQQPDYSSGTVAQIFSQCQLLAPNRIFWGMKTGAPGDWFSQVIPVINANPTLNGTCPSEYSGTCFAGGGALSPPTWSAVPALNFVQGTASSYNLNAYCASAVSFALHTGTLETGVTLNGSTGLLSYNGSSPVAASGALTFSATNGSGTANSGSTTSAIAAAPPPPPVWSALPAFNFTQGTASNYNLNSYCANAASFALQSGTLEAGVTLNGVTGVLSYNGTNPVASSAVLVFSATNTVSTVNSGSTTSAIVAPAPAWSALPALNFTQGTAANYNLNAYCANAASFALASGALETGVTLNGVTGAVSYNGTSPVAASGALTFRATNGAGSAVSGSTTSAIGAAVLGFDHYIGPSGNDGNAGTVTSPWAITSLRTVSANFASLAGKRVGFLPGTYNVSALMVVGSSSVGALQFQGGTSALGSSYYASCDASGNYSPRTAIITALTSGGGFGGGLGWPNNGPIISGCGQYPSVYNAGYITIDGLVISGFNYKGIRIGGGSSGDGPTGLNNVVVQNCLFTGGGFNAGNATDNCAALWIDCCNAAVVSNNKFLNNIGQQTGGADHLNGVIVWGSANNYNTSGTIITNNTLINAGNIFGKETSVQGSTVAYNYVDMSMYTVIGNAGAIQDFTGANQSGLTQTTNFHHNILLSSNTGISSATLSQSEGFTTPVNAYNNTIVMTSNNASTPYPAAWVVAQSGGSIKFYNNIYAGAADHSGYGTFITNGAGVSVWDYNLLTTGMNWVLRTNGALASITGTYASLAAFKAAVLANGGPAVDAHSVQNNVPGFANTGTLAALYLLAGGSPAINAGRVGGISSGTAVSMGAQDGSGTPGSNF